MASSSSIVDVGDDPPMDDGMESDDISNGDGNYVIDEGDVLDFDE